MVMPILVQRRQLLHDAATAIETSRDMNVAGLASVLLQVVGPFNGIIRVQLTIDETNWETATSASLGDGSFGDTITEPGLYSLPIAGAVLLRSQILLLSQGTITITAHANAPEGTYPFVEQNIGAISGVVPAIDTGGHLISAEARLLDTNNKLLWRIYRQLAHITHFDFE